MINKIDFNDKNLTSNPDFIFCIFESDSVNKIKLNHGKTMLCRHFIVI